MKRFLTLCLMVFAVAYTMHGCGCDGGENAGLVFVNQSGATIVAVVVDFKDQNGGQQHADGSPLKRGETFGFEAGEYPVTVAVYEAPFESLEQKELGQTTIQKAPPEGERWYVTARDGVEGLTFLISTQLLDPDEG